MNKIITTNNIPAILHFFKAGAKRLLLYCLSFPNL